MSCPLVSCRNSHKFIFLLLLKCASLKQKFDISDSVLLASYFSIFFAVVLMVKNAPESSSSPTVV